MIAMRRVDFPQPDSPTRPKLSPAMMSSEKSGRATTVPAEVRYSTERFRIERSGSMFVFFPVAAPPLLASSLVPVAAPPLLASFASLVGQRQLAEAVAEKI